MRKAERQGGTLHGFLTECYMLLTDTALANLANKLVISQFIIGDYWDNFYSHCYHGLGAARLRHCAGRRARIKRKGSTDRSLTFCFALNARSQR